MEREFDQELINDMLSSDQRKRKKAIDRIYSYSFGHVKTLVFKYKADPPLAEDIFQEGLMTLFQNLKLGRFRGESSLHTYLFNICRYQLYKVVKNQNKELPLVPLDEIGSLYTNIDDITPIIKIPSVREIMSELHAECKQLLIDFYFEGKSMKELMKRFELGSEQAAKNKKLRCMKALIRLMEQKGLGIHDFLS